MGNRYAVVLRTYFCWSMPVAAVGILSLAFPFLLAATWKHRSPPDDYAIFSIYIAIVAAAGLVGFGLWNRLREQIAGTQRCLSPNYFETQLLIFATLWIALACVWPVLLATATRLSALGVSAYVAAITAIFGCMIAGTPKIRMVILFSSPLWFQILLPGEAVQKILSGQLQLLAAIVFCCALGASVVLVIQMLRMTEDDAGYAQTVASSAWVPGSRAPTLPSGPKLSERLGLEPKLQLSALAPTYGGTIARSRRWRATIKQYWWMPLLMSAMGLVAQFVMFSRPGGVPQAWMLFPTGIVLVTSVQFVLNPWLVAWPSIESDLTRPIERGSFFQAIGTAITIQLLQAWTPAAVVFLAGGVLFGIPLVVVSSLVFASFAVQTFLFGLAAWAQRYRPRILQWGISMATTMPMILMNGFGRYTITSAPLNLCLASLVVTLLGILLLRTAYHRWLETEFG